MSSWFSKKSGGPHGRRKKKENGQEDQEERDGNFERSIALSLPAHMLPASGKQAVLLTSDNYGTRNPLDWESTPDSLRAKFPHWKEHSVPSPTIKKRDNLPSPPAKKSTHVPENTIPYIVMECDTLVSIALKFDTTTSDIARANNKLGNSCPIYPGELLYIPDISVVSRNETETSSSNNRKNNKEENKEETDRDKKKLNNSEIKGFEVEGSETKGDDSKYDERGEEEEGVGEQSFADQDIVEESFICVPSKFMSEQLCVHGSLFLKPDFIMFRPDSNDPLVEDNGLALYEVLIPLNEIVHAYIMSSYSLPTSTVISAISPPIAPPPTFVAPPTSCSDSNRLPSPHSTTPPEQDPLDGNVNPLLLDMASHNNATTPSNEDHASSNDPPTHHNEERRDTLGSLFQEENEGKKDGEVEDGCYGDDLAPLPGPWSFLYLRVSQSSQQSPANPIIGIEIPEPRTKRSSSPNVRSVRTWFIFAFPTPRLKNLFNFIFKFHPSSSSDTNVASMTTIDESAQLSDSKRLEIINLKGQYSDDSLVLSETHFASSWEIFSVRDFQPLRIECMDVESNLPLPQLLETSDFLSNKHLRKLTLNLVSSAIGHDWFLVYSTARHGISLQTLYRNFANFGESPSVLLVKDENGKLFGAILSCPIRRSDRFYGTGESLLFSFDDEGEIKVYPWAGNNDYVIKGSGDSIAIGGGTGHFGLWLDEGFYHGSSFRCTTYNNEPLASKEDFIIHGVEVWGFE